LLLLTAEQKIRESANEREKGASKRQSAIKKEMPRTAVAASCVIIHTLLSTKLLFETKSKRNLWTFVSHCGLAIYIKNYLKVKKKKVLWKLKYFTMNFLKIKYYIILYIYNLQKKFSKRNQNIYHLSKILI
jgi:hypothetical protein